MVQHVSRQIQTFLLLLLPVAFTCNGPVESTPVEVNGESILTRKSGSGVLSRVFPQVSYTRHLWRIHFTNNLPLSIQYLARTSVRVSFMPLWKTLMCTLSTNHSIKAWFLGGRMGSLVVYGTSAFDNLPPHLKSPSGSMKRLNYFFQPLNCVHFMKWV